MRPPLVTPPYVHDVYSQTKALNSCRIDAINSSVILDREVRCSGANSDPFHSAFCICSRVQKQHDLAGKSLFEDANASILQDPSLKSTYLIIDALDECAVADLPSRHVAIDNSIAIGPTVCGGRRLYPALLAITLRN